MGDQLAHRHPARRRAQPRGVAVPPVQHLDVGELRPVLLHRRIEVQLPALHLLQRGDRGDHLGHGHDAELRGRPHRGVVGADRLHARAALVEDAVAVGGDRGDVRNGAVVDTLLQHPVDAGCVLDLHANLLGDGPLLAEPILAAGGLQGKVERDQMSLQIR